MYIVMTIANRLCCSLLTFFSISVVFSNEDGGTTITDLKPIAIDFRDLFQPLPKFLLDKVHV